MLNVQKLMYTLLFKIKWQKVASLVIRHVYLVKMKQLVVDVAQKDSYINQIV